MKKILILFVLVGIYLNIYSFSFISVNQENDQVISIIDTDYHMDYGFKIPLTYKVQFNSESTNLFAQFKYSYINDWEVIKEYNKEDFFNNEIAVRFDYENKFAYISIPYGESTDTVFIRIVDQNEQKVGITFLEITKFYDNRDMAVIGSADDMAEWSRTKFNTSIKHTRERNLWLTIGINPDGCNSTTWYFIQRQMVLGYVEPASHTNNHPNPNQYGHYGADKKYDYEYEILNSKEKIIQNLQMTDLFSCKGRRYVYTFIAPNGYTDNIIDSLVGAGKYLVNRLYYPGYYGFSEWDSVKNSFYPIGVGVAIDPPREQLGWGIGCNNLDSLNAAFDYALSKNTVYHFMFHPNVVEWDKAYTLEHLDYISNRKNVWYTSVGHLYLYHFAQINYISSVDTQEQNHILSVPLISLIKSYPNPTSSTYNIKYMLFSNSDINLYIFNNVGQVVFKGVYLNQNEGTHVININLTDLPSGIYFYSIQAKDKIKTGKVVKIQ